VADTEPGTRVNRTGSPGAEPPDTDADERAETPVAPGPWIATSVAVMVLAFGLLGLRAYGLAFFGTLGVVGVFALAELLGVCGLAFSMLALTAGRRDDTEQAAEDGSIGRRCAVCGLVFLGAMAIITVAAHLVPTAMVS
jgi:uncharacterized membrane protein YidH (DUF202 family)